VSFAHVLCLGGLACGWSAFSSKWASGAGIPRGEQPTVEQNGLGLSLKDALANARQFQEVAAVCGESPRVCRRLQELAAKTKIGGRKLHVRKNK
jgi:hypothetical protein